jgi:two-component sensor histidine kinase
VVGASLQGNTVAMSTALRASLIQTVPWIPVTLAIIALAARFPVERRTWRRALPIHVGAFLALAYVENVLVVLGYWASNGVWNGATALLSGARTWTLVRLHVAALVYLAIGALTQGLIYFRQGRQRELRLARVEAQLAQARLDALNAQIRPHFLFNTLHTIGHLWRSDRAQEADEMLDHLGALFQRVHESTGRPLISLDQEMETVLAYLAIETARFSDRMRIQTDIDEASRDLAVPPLLLQPLVENAVRHGIAVSSAAGRIAVTSRREGDRLHICIEDDGPGMNAGTVGRGSGTGLRNTRERLAQMFGADQRIDITSNTSGTTVRITMPAVPCEPAPPAPAVATGEA